MESSDPGPRKTEGSARSVLREMGRILAHPPAVRASDRRALAFLLLTFVVVFSLLGVTFYLFASQPPSSAPSPIGFTSPLMASGNASFAVSRVDGGPFAATGFTIDLVVNYFAAPPTPLGPTNVSAFIVIGKVGYLVTWSDADGSGTVSLGDSFRVTGTGTSLPPISTVTFRLVWQGGWSASVSWATSSE